MPVPHFTAASSTPIFPTVQVAAPAIKPTLAIPAQTCQVLGRLPLLALQSGHSVSATSHALPELAYQHPSCPSSSHSARNNPSQLGSKRIQKPLPKLTKLTKLLIRNGSQQLHKISRV
ncbi:hypothetical protein DSO57_1035372 [Entomophthora muscae]|uniref:Uncharacterized protein n=1 Tax=Entomophthora muscae TaxID=34485 RepID=A0ACC2U9N7_9FUNG|nr:hypothetical protein DSO57_1035372 [Entomophthora muscae]